MYSHTTNARCYNKLTDGVFQFLTIEKYMYIHFIIVYHISVSKTDTRFISNSGWAAGGGCCGGIHAVKSTCRVIAPPVLQCLSDCHRFCLRLWENATLMISFHETK